MPAVQTVSTFGSVPPDAAARDSFEASELDIEWSFQLCFQSRPATNLASVEPVMRTPAVRIALEIGAAQELEESEIDLEYSFRA